MRHKVRINEAGNEWLRHLEARGMTEGTVRNRTYTLTQFREAAGRDLVLDDITPLHVDKWRASGAWSANTSNRKLGELKAFFAWCKARGYMNPAIDPMIGQKAQPVATKERLRIPQDEWATVLDSAPHPLERILVACGLYLMARASELREIRMRDVDLDAGEVLVYRRKVRRHDTLPVCAELDLELRRWLTWYGQNATGPIGPESYLLAARERFVERDPVTGSIVRVSPKAPVNPAMPVTRAHRHVQMVLKPLGYEIAREGGHTLRRSAARAFYDELKDDGYDGALRMVQTMLDHNTTATTEVYLGLSLDKERRNKALAGKPMFKPRPVAGNVVSLDSRREA